MAQEIPNQQPDVPTDAEQPATATAVTATGTKKDPSVSRYPCRMPIRMTQAERATIGKKAYARDLSISRYLVESGVGNNGVGDKHGQAADPARLRYLQVLFQDAADKAKSLLASPLLLTKNELTNDVRIRLEEAAYLLKALSGELARRLP